MRLSIALALLGASFGFALPNAVSSSTLQSRDTLCGGYTPVKKDFDIGDRTRSIQEDKVRTHVYWEEQCLLAGTKYTISFVTLSDCQPLPTKYGKIVENQSLTDMFYIGGAKKNVTVNADDSATFVCPGDKTEGQLYILAYDVYYGGLYSGDFLNYAGYKVVLEDPPF